MRLRDMVLATTVVEDVSVATLVVAGSPRLGGEDDAYVQSLAEVESPLPPLIVHRGTMRVIDGIHRLQAAVSLGRRTVAVRYFEGTSQEAALLSVTLNISHGRPLSLEDRMAAALRIFRSHPHWSDRSVAVLAGLSAAKVAALRRDSGTAPSNVRIGRDGRARPVDASAGREHARRLLEENPGTSMRQIARTAGISAATAADVRDRMRRGESAVPARRSPPERSRQVSVTVPRLAVDGPSRPQRDPEELTRAIEELKQDPALRQNEAGRALLRMLMFGTALAREPERITAALPWHCYPRLAELLHDYARVCEGVADRLKRRSAEGPAGRTPR
ncbi:ParB/RepB/Spo0J family partition protein [Streptomyces apocyni]|uniref:ParB/RepB/Spo0J family partition protein n=1 Tax=Streptomyces apocyni TaxID=2654677 RepID=UPI0018D038DF|nr:ParB N-terminal domain-containing protein [Streptomyces apocyni]